MVKNNNNNDRQGSWRWQPPSSIKSPFNSLYAISYRCSILTESLSPAVFEILGYKHIGLTVSVTTLTFQGHGTSSVMWPFDLPYAISYLWFIRTEPLSRNVQPFSRCSALTHVNEHTITNKHDVSQYLLAEIITKIKTCYLSDDYTVHTAIHITTYAAQATELTWTFWLKASRTTDTNLSFSAAAQK